MFSYSIYIEMESLNQGIYFKDKKRSYKSLVKPQVNKSIEGFSVREGLETRMMQFNDQVLDFHGGSLNGDKDKQQSMTLANATKKVTNDEDYYGFEYNKDQTKVIFRSYKNGVLPKNNGKVPGLKYQKGWTTYLRLNNGMPEAKVREIGDGNAIDKAQAMERREMQKLENEYMLLLGQYKSTYKSYLDEVVAATSASSTDMANQIRIAPNGRRVYIGGTGVAREFDPNSWSNKDSTCPQAAGNITQEQLNQLTKGTNMGQGEACRTGGYVAKTPAGTMAWISPSGTSHVFSDYINRHGTCPSTYTNVTNKQFDAIPKGSNYGAQDSCEIIQLDTGAGRKVIAMNERLKELSTQMRDLATGSDHNAHDIAKIRKKKFKNMKKVLDEIQTRRQEINLLRQNIETSRASAEAQRQEVATMQYKYVAWALAGMTLGMMAIRQIVQAK